jgi:predicted N-acetyltransferase YhbS
MSLQPVLQAHPEDRSDIEKLLDEAFGADRQNRTTYRLRENNKRLDGLSRVVRQEDGHLCGSIEFWPVDLVCNESGSSTNAVLLGPIAVAESCRGQGIGSVLMKSGLAAARAAGHETIVLVGDPEYYGRFGFSNDVTESWSLPGPVEQRRLLVKSDAFALPTVATVTTSLSLEQPHGNGNRQARK